MEAVLAAHGMNQHDVGVMEESDGLGLALEAIQDVFINFGAELIKDGIKRIANGV